MRGDEVNNKDVCGHITIDIRVVVKDCIHHKFVPVKSFVIVQCACIWPS